MPDKNVGKDGKRNFMKYIPSNYGMAIIGIVEVAFAAVSLYFALKGQVLWFVNASVLIINVGGVIASMLLKTPNVVVAVVFTEGVIACLNLAGLIQGGLVHLQCSSDFLFGRSFGDSEKACYNFALLLMLEQILLEFPIHLYFLRALFIHRLNIIDSLKPPAPHFVPAPEDHKRAKTNVFVAQTNSPAASTVLQYQTNQHYQTNDTVPRSKQSRGTAIKLREVDPNGLALPPKSTASEWASLV